MKTKDFDVDIVITWVDGSDKQWIKEKNEYPPKEKQTDVDLSNALIDEYKKLRFVIKTKE